MRPREIPRTLFFVSIKPKGILRLKFMMKIGIFEAYAETEKYPLKPT